MLEKLKIFFFIASLLFSACEKKDKGIIGSPSPQPSPLSNEKIDEIKNQIKEVVKERLVPCSSDGFRYAIYKSEIIKIWHLQVSYGQSELLQEYQKANGSWFKQNFQFVKSDSIPKGEANDLLYQSYDATENSWSKWKPFAPQSFTAEFIKNQSPSIPEFYASYKIPRSGLCQAINEQKNLGEFLKSETDLSPNSTTTPQNTPSSKDSNSFSPTPTPNLREQAKNSLNAKAIVEKYFERELKCNSNYYLVQCQTGNFMIWEFSKSDYQIVDTSFTDDFINASIYVKVQGGKRYEWSNGCQYKESNFTDVTPTEKFTSLVDPNTRVISFEVEASRKSGEEGIRNFV